MTAEAQYERYKDALKRGHVASLRGRVEEALTAYAEAAAIAPERATPHTSAGTALLRRRRPVEALRHYEAALRLSPRDEAALLGRAQALGALDRRSEAADAFDALAHVQADAGRLGDAVDAARIALELAEGRERRRTLHQLIDRLRRSEPREPGRIALERALRVLEDPAGAGAAGEGAGATVDGPADKRPGAESEVEQVPGLAAQPGLEAQQDPEPGPAPESVVRVYRALDRELPVGTDLEALAIAVEADVEPEDQVALNRLLDLAAGSLREGRVDAALDACYHALSVDPDSVELHLALVQLYEVRGWTAIAGEKLDLVGRLADLDADEVAAARVAGARAAHR